jgi:hypothetical protein
MAMYAALPCHSKNAVKDYRERLPGKSAGQVCRASLPGKSAGQVGQVCRACLPGKSAGHVRSKFVMDVHRKNFTLISILIMSDQAAVC